MDGAASSLALRRAAGTGVPRSSPSASRHRATVGPYGGEGSYERGTHVLPIPSVSAFRFRATTEYKQDTSQSSWKIRPKLWELEPLGAMAGAASGLALRRPGGTHP